MNSSGLEEIRQMIESCRNRDNVGCKALIDYRENANVAGASHPVLFQIVNGARIMIIGAVPGSLDAAPAYQRLVNGQFSLGYKSARGLGEIMVRVGEIRDIGLPSDLTRMPVTKHIQEKHLLARARLCLHVTNLVKCHAPKNWESKETEAWRLAGDACQSRHLASEVSALEPEMVVLLGKEVAYYFSDKENWGRQRLRISKWAEQAEYLTFFGKSRFVTAWAHPAGPYFWTQGKKYWDLYARQMAEFVS